MGANGSNPLLSAKKVFCSDITQLVECSAVNTEVIGSNPIIRAKYFWFIRYWRFMFIKNKYTKIYFKIISRARKRNISGYKEKHHIIPRSVGGNNYKNNIVDLTAREHFLCHVLLSKMFLDETNKCKMLHAIMFFKGQNSSQIRIVNSKLYDKAKKLFSLHIKSVLTGRKLKDSHKENISLSMKGKSKSDETKKKLSESASKRKRKPFTEEYKKKMSEKMKLVHQQKRSNS